jgi:hypothetical protein
MWTKVLDDNRNKFKTVRSEHIEYRISEVVSNFSRHSLIMSFQQPLEKTCGFPWVPNETVVVSFAPWKNTNVRIGVEDWEGSPQFGLRAIQ